MNREEAIAKVREELNNAFFTPCFKPDVCVSKDCKRFLELLNDAPGAPVITGGPEPDPYYAVAQNITRTTGMSPALAAPYGTEPESILQEAHRLTHGDRRADYGHPLDDYSRTAGLVSTLLAHKLKEPLTADEMALAMVCVKLSRQIHRPKRDNTVDGAGYFWVAQECIDEAARRAK